MNSNKKKSVLATQKNHSPSVSRNKEQASPADLHTSNTTANLYSGFFCFCFDVFSLIEDPHWAWNEIKAPYVYCANDYLALRYLDS